ncbi:MAG: RraA family protein [Vulcanimicrobiaceae bacterium]
MNGRRDPALARIAALDTATVSDALDRLGVLGQCHGIAPRAHAFRMAGRAHTLSYCMAANPAGSVGDYIDDVAPGSVLLLDNGGRDTETVWGDILTEIAHRRGIAGTVIDGICRDVQLCLDLGYPIFSRGHWMRTGKDRVQLEAVNVPVTIGGVRAAAGDLVFGDADGVVIVPALFEERVLSLAEEISSVEERIRLAVRSGRRLDDARREFGYHTLQSRESAR